MEESLGILRKQDVRTRWNHEIDDFTPWLKRPENLEQLEQVLGMSLKIVADELPIGAFVADLVAIDQASGRFVVIENQLAHADHGHMAQALTYSSAFNDRGVVTVWIAASFADAHLETLHWLNTQTPDQVAFYGVVLELWQIDDSRPVVHFTTVVRPWDRVKQELAETLETLKTEQATEEWSDETRAAIDQLKSDTEKIAEVAEVAAALGRNIVRYRKARQLTQRELARRTGVDRTYLSQIENGKFNVSVALIYRIAQVLEVTADQLLGW